MTCDRVITVRPDGGTAGRRGVLLLVVLSMLTLFLMLGAAYMVTASRARETARAHARLTFGGDDVRTPYARLLDTVAMAVVRGGMAPVAAGGPPVVFEPLLADKYGLVGHTGTISGASLSGPVITATLTTGSAFPTDLNGRVLTFTEPGRRPTSHRIIRASASGGPANVLTKTFVVALDVPSRSAAISLPVGPCRVIINGQEYAGAAPDNESWDGFDANNLFLAQVAPGPTMSSSTVSRLSYVGPPPAGFGPSYEYGPPDQVPEAADNDGDGVPDGIFLDFGLPDAVDAAGNVVQLRASVLAIDLDGRFNVNAHGSLAPVVYGDSHPGWTTNPTVVTTGSLAAVPMGSGYGPAEIAANLGEGNSPKTPGTVTSGTPRMFDATFLVASGTENPKLLLLTGARGTPSSQPGTGVPRMRGRRFQGSRYANVGSNPSNPAIANTTGEAVTPRLRPVEGKYGEQSPDGAWISVSATLSDPSLNYARPGRPNVADAAGDATARRADPDQPVAVNYGVPTLWWNSTGTFNAGAAGSIHPLPRGVYNSPPDLHGRMKTLTLSATTTGTVSTANSGTDMLSPRLVFVQPEWSSGTDAREIKDNPYEFQLDTRPGFGGCLKDPATDGQSIGTPNVNNAGMLADNPFTPSELEAVLRPYDIDTNRCQPRLAALLGSAAEDCRLKVTTDSWDTTAIVGGTGAAADQLVQWLRSATNGTLYGSDPVSGIIGGEVARGERFDLNRPLTASEPANAGYSVSSPYHVQRQAYFKDLYTLLIALEQGGGAALAPTRVSELAQWAANVVEFRDADSRITPFEYDTDPRNGWSVDGDVGTADGGGERGVVWGVERPEVLIREVLAWDANNGGLIVSLHRPWNASALSRSGTIAGEPCDYALDTLCSPTNLNMVTGASGIPGNIVDLGKKAGPGVLTPNANSNYNDTTAGTYPIWRLRLVAGATFYARFDTAAGSASEFTPQALSSGNDKPKLPVDGTLSLYSGTTIPFAKVGGGTATGTVALSGSSCRMSSTFRVPTGQVAGMLYLERLSDPSRSPTNAQWSADPLANLTTGTDTLRYVVVDSCAVVNLPTTTPGASAVSQRRAASSATTAWWKNDYVTGTSLSATSLLAQWPTVFPTAQRANVAWFPWLNRPFTSAAELVLVPRADSVGLLTNYQVITEASAPTVSIPLSAGLTAARLFDAVHVPTRFAGINTSGTADTFANTGISTVTTTVNQFSAFREPGRVNLNTVTSDDVWNTVVGGPLPTVVVSRTTAGLSTNPATNLASLLGVGAGGGVVVSDTASAPAILGWDKNPLHRFYTATRLANTVTPRSNVFAVWVTLRAMVPGDPDSVEFHRAFYIIDRSIPVGFELGRTHNAWDCVRLRRVVE